jgi:sensor histidine kinase YesM/ligand-binding sensor domain-containing protein
MLFSIKNKFFSLLFFITSVVLSQTIPSRNITINDGLPSNNIKCIFKDSRGLLWIGTEDGLCSYNGKEYKIYNEENGLKCNSVWSIAEDNHQNLWFSLYGEGIAKFDGKKFSYYNTSNGLIHNSVRKIYFSKKHNCLLLGTENGLSLFDGKKFKSFTEKTIIDKFQVMGINEDQNRLLVSVNWHKTFNLKIAKDISKSSLVVEFEPIPSFSSLLKNNIYYSGGSEGFLYQRDLKTNTITTQRSNKIWDFAYDSSNNIYCASWNVNDPNGGLYKLSNGKLIDISKNANINSTSLWCLYYDDITEQLWVGSTDKGIFVVDLSNKIKLLNPDFFGLKTLETQSLFITEDNTTWIGARDYIIILKSDFSYTIIDKKGISNKVANYLQSIVASQEQLISYKTFKTRNGFTCFNITSDKQGYIWVNTTSGTFCFDKKQKLLFYDFGSGSGGNIAFDKNDSAIFSIMYNKTCVFKNKFDWTLKLKEVTDLKTKPINVQKIFNDGTNIWYGSYTKGLYIYKEGKFVCLNQIKQFHEKNIKDLIVDSNGYLVVGTNLGNVYVLKQKEDQLNQLFKYSSNIDIIGTTITFIEEIDGCYFIGTNKGINIVKNNKLLKLLNKSEGILDLQINDCTKDSSGNLLLAINNGIIKLNAKKILNQISKRHNDIQINDIKINGEHSVFMNNFEFGVFNSNQIILEYFQNDIEIYFSANNLFNADKNVYRYKIEGLNNKWSAYESIDKINLRGLPNGTFRLIIEGKNIGTGQIFKTRTLSIEIISPFWETTIFTVLVILFITGLSFFLVKKRIKRIKNEAELKNLFNKRLAETKMEALQSQMNPHFIFNAMNSIQNFIIDNKTDDALMYMGEFSKLIRQTLNNSSKQYIKLSEEIQYLKTYINLERMRFPFGVEFSLEIEKVIDKNKVEIPPMLIQPFIENVFVHAFDSDSKDAKLTIQFSLVSNELQCKIIDNGQGFNKLALTKLKKSKGIRLVKERFELFQSQSGNVHINSKINQGTTITLQFKLHL